MGSLVYLRHGIENSPYRSLLETNQWAEICNIFTRDACALLGLSVESPLSVRFEKPWTNTQDDCSWFPFLKNLYIYTKVETRVKTTSLISRWKSWVLCLFLYSFASGCMALPVLMNIKQVIEQRQCSGVWTHKDELPVRVFLNFHLCFNSVPPFSWFTLFIFFFFFT